MVNSIAAVLVAASMAGAVPAASPAIPAAGIRASTSRVVTEAAQAARVLPRAAIAPRARRPAGAIAAGVVLGGVAGLFAGGFVGYKLERTFGDCNCDDPGLKGLFIGAPIGAIAGAILGGKFLFR